MRQIKFKTAIQLHRRTRNKSHFYRASRGIHETYSWDRNSVRPSVRPSLCPVLTRVLCDETKEHRADILTSHERVINLVS